MSERQEYYERAWLIRVWYDFDKKYPLFVQQASYSTSITIIVQLEGIDTKAFLS